MEDISEKYDELQARYNQISELLRATFDDVKLLQKEQEDTQHRLHDAHEFTENIVDSMHDGYLVLDGNLTVVAANRAFYSLFQVRSAETVGRKIYELGNNQWDIPRLRILLEEIIPNCRFRRKAPGDSETRYPVDSDVVSMGFRFMLSR